MAHFYQSAFMEALGWSLLSSFWKMGSLWIAYVIITGNQKWHSAKVRYILSLLFMTAGTIWSFADLNSYYKDIIAGKEIFTLTFYVSKNITGLAATEWLMPYISAAYILMLVLFSGRLFYKYCSGKTALSKDLRETDSSINQILGSLLENIGITKKVKIFFSPATETPLTVGFFKPMILLPIAVINQLSIEQTESLIAHELFHIRHNDYLVNILVSFTGLLLFFNPFAKLFQGMIQHERENICDDEVMALGFDRWQYAHALYTLGKQHSICGNFAMAATGQGQLLLERIARILKVSVRKPSNRLPAVVVRPLMLFFLCLVLSISLKKPQRPEDVKATAAVPVINKPPLADEEAAMVIVKKTSETVIIRRSQRLRKTKPKEMAAVKNSIRLPEMNLRVPAPPPLMDEIVNSFVSATHEMPEFTLTIPELAVAPGTGITPEASVPYVPSVTFYYSNTEKSLQTRGKKVVHL